MAWICAAAMEIAISGAAYLLCRLGEYLTGWLGTLPTISVVILAVLFGGTFLGLFTYSVWTLPTLLVAVSDRIYPTRRAVRFYVIGGYTLLGCAIVILGAIMGAVRGGSMFWFYVRFIYVAAASVITMVYGYVAAADRNGTEEGTAALEKDKQKRNQVLAKVAITAVMWGIARAIPVFVDAVYPLGFWMLFVSAFMLPFGWGAALAISKGKYSMCIRVNLYVMAALEGVGAFRAAINELLHHTYNYNAVIYLIWAAAVALYLGICIYLAGMVDKVKT